MPRFVDVGSFSTTEEARKAAERLLGRNFGAIVAVNEHLGGHRSIAYANAVTLSFKPGPEDTLVVTATDFSG